MKSPIKYDCRSCGAMVDSAPTNICEVCGSELTELKLYTVFTNVWAVDEMDAVHTSEGLDDWDVKEATNE